MCDGKPRMLESRYREDMGAIVRELSAAEVEQIKAYVMRREYDDYLKAQQAAKP